MKNLIIKTAARNAVLTVFYIVVLVLLPFFAEKIIGPDLERIPEILFPIFMLSLFVFSAALTGFLVFGGPVIWYLDGRKQEALSLLAYTLEIFLGIVVVGALLVVILA